MDEPKEYTEIRGWLERWQAQSKPGKPLWEVIREALIRTDDCLAIYHALTGERDRLASVASSIPDEVNKMIELTADAIADAEVGDANPEIQKMLTDNVLLMASATVDLLPKIMKSRTDTASLMVAVNNFLAYQIRYQVFCRDDSAFTKAVRKDRLVSAIKFLAGQIPAFGDVFGAVSLFAEMRNAGIAKVKSADEVMEFLRDYVHDAVNWLEHTQDHLSRSERLRATLV
jgi:hypothetical protein